MTNDNSDRITVMGLQDAQKLDVVLALTWPNSTTTRQQIEYRCLDDRITFWGSKLWLPWSVVVEGVEGHDLEISGDGDHYSAGSPNGYYDESDGYNGLPSYYCAETDMDIYAGDETPNYWCLGPHLSIPSYLWILETTSHIGTYVTVGEATGSAIVAAGPEAVEGSTTPYNAADLSLAEDAYVQGWIGDREIIAPSPARHIFGCQAYAEDVLAGKSAIRPFPFTLRRGDILRLLVESRSPFLGKADVSGHLVLHGYR